MTSVVLLAMGLALKVPAQLVTAVAFGLVWPGPVLVVLFGVAIVQRARRVQNTEVEVLTAIAGELRAGHNLRGALISVGSEFGGSLDAMYRRARVGNPLELVADELEGELPRQGRLAAATVRMASGLGGQTANVFDRLAVLAQEDDEVRREGVAASAAVRSSAIVIGGTPLVLVAWQLLSGGLRDVFLLPLGPPMVVGGLALVVVGSAVVATMMQRALR